MKRFIKYTLAIVASAALFSCSKNEAPTFDDANAFVSFSSGSAMIDESKLDDATGEYTATGDIVTLTASLASIKGLEASISFEIVPTEITLPDGSKLSPKEGVNYKVLNEDNVLRFDAEHRSREIKIQGLYYPEYTGDLYITVKLNSSDVIKKTSAQGSCKVTICDVDHPLSAILGSYTMSGVDQWSGPGTWNMTILKDADDASKCWFNNLTELGTNDKFNFYGTVDEDLSQILIPFGQTNQYKYSDASTLMYLYGVDADYEIYDSGAMTVEIVKNADGKVTGLKFDPTYGFWNITWGDGVVMGDNNLNFAIKKPGLSATKN